MKVLIIFSVISIISAAVSAKDITVGDGGNQFFHKNLTASPAIWRQDHNITINTDNEEVISKVVITDNRPDKDGEAKIVEGGEGHQNVTIELKSPAVFRGYDFTIEVFSSKSNGLNQNFQGSDSNHPAIVPMGMDIDVNDKTQARQNTAEVFTPKLDTAQENKDILNPTLTNKDGKQGRPKRTEQTSTASVEQTNGDKLKTMDINEQQDILGSALNIDLSTAKNIDLTTSKNVDPAAKNTGITVAKNIDSTTAKIDPTSGKIDPTSEKIDTTSAKNTELTTAKNAKGEYVPRFMTFDASSTTEAFKTTEKVSEITTRAPSNPKFMTPIPYNL